MFYLVLMLCAQGYSNACISSTLPAAFPTYDECRQAYGATSKFDDKNTLMTKGFACVVGPEKKLAAN